MKYLISILLFPFTLSGQIDLDTLDQKYIAIDIYNKRKYSLGYVDGLVIYQNDEIKYFDNAVAVLNWMDKRGYDFDCDCVGLVLFRRKD